MQTVKNIFGSVMFFMIVLAYPALGQHKLTLHFSKMGVHIGQTLSIRVIDKSTMIEVGRTVIPTVGSADFDVELFVLVQGQSYRIDFFTDVNMNGRYDPPTTDHAWRLDLDHVQGDTELQFVHIPDFTDIQWGGTFDPEQYAGEWVGTWWNYDAGSSENANATVTIIPDSMKIRIHSTSRLILGNPEVQTLNSEGYYTANKDRAVINAPNSWEGQVVVTHGEFTGSGSAGGYQIQVRGNLGLNQMICEFNLTGFFNFRGIILMTKEPISDVAYLGSNNPIQFSLDQNYPNPFNPRTMIRFHLDRAASVTLKVFDTTGREVANLMDQAFKMQGSYEVQFNGDELPSGYYIYRLSAGELTESRKMILLK